jgi:hypothetical protein
MVIVKGAVRGFLEGSHRHKNSQLRNITTVPNPLVVQVMAMIVGDMLAPWEDPATSGNILKKLGFFRRAVLPLLNRDPSQRPTMAAAERCCQCILSDAPTYAAK